MDLFAQVSLALLDQAKVEKATVLGLSMGGYVAFELWSRAKDGWARGALRHRATPDTPDARKGREATAHAVEDDGIGVLAERMIPTSSPAGPEALKRDLEKMITENSADGARRGAAGDGPAARLHRALKEIACPAWWSSATRHAHPPAEAQPWPRRSPAPGSRRSPARATSPTWRTRRRSTRRCASSSTRTGGLSGPPQQQPAAPRRRGLRPPAAPGNPAEAG
jgi:pimeloyl-ACP methyl ester carboxylesterase